MLVASVMRASASLASPAIDHAAKRVLNSYLTEQIVVSIVVTSESIALETGDGDRSSVDDNKIRYCHYH